MSALLAFCVSLIGTGLLVRWFTRVNIRQVVSEDVPERHRRTKQGTPSMGGIAIIPGILCGMCADSNILSTLCAPVALENVHDKAVFLTFVLFGVIGFIDDLLIAKRGKSLGLRAREKLVLQFLAAGFIGWLIFTYAFLPLTPDTSLRPENNLQSVIAMLIPFAVLVVAYANAGNLTDGLDGLCAGMFAIASLAVLAVLVVERGTGFLATPVGSSAALWPLTISAALLGFLWHNAHPARIFMGDTGSLALGAGAAMMSLTMLGVVWTLFILMIPLLEMLSVVLQVASFKLTGKRIFKMAPLHHHFELCGWSETQVVTRFWIAQAVVGLIAVVLAWGGGV